MKKNLLFPGFTIFITLGLLLSLAYPTSVQAQISFEKTAGQDPLIVELVKPVAVGDMYTLDLGTATTLCIPAPGVLANDYDPDGDPITAVSPTQPANGYVILRSDGSFDYTPEPGFSGDDVFTYKASDGTLTSTPAQVKITVTGGNTTPVANPDTYFTEVNTQLVVPAPGVLANDLDADGDALTAVKLGDPAHGTLMLYPNGSFTYTPTLNYSGDDIFTYQASDGMATSTPTQVTITISGGGNTEPDANSDAYVTDIGVQLVVDALTGVLANDFDVDGDTLTAVLWVAPINGSLNLQPDGSFVYTPLPGYYGDDHFTYQAFDGLAYSDPTLVTITVNPINTPPTAAADMYETPMNTTLTIVAPGVLANDVDVDLDPLTADLLGSPPEFGILNLSSNGSFTYIPQVGYVGSVYFTYRAFDGIDYSAPVQVTIEVTSLNTPPTAVADSYTMLMNTTLNVAAVDGVLANDSDVDGDSLTAEVLGTPVIYGTLVLNGNGSFTYDPNDDYFGSVYFTYRAYDGLEYSEPVLVTINVKQSNLAPTAVTDSYYIDSGLTLTVSVADGVLDNDSDPDGDPLQSLLVDGVDHGLLSLHRDGSLVYVPAVGFVGVDSFTYRAYDGLAYSGVTIVEITVGEEVNMAPVVMDDNYVVGVGVTLMVAAPGVLANDYDVNGDSFTAELGTDVLHGTLTFHNNGSFVYVPDPGFAGVDQFTYRAYDGELYSELVTVTIYVRLITYMPF
ncbi:MAG TPA: Ig-like domain-containing protein, partial [Anaerolineales bacterium]|nr:Ig-like domain-containing protein [Anaerolineales bacterium]